MFLEEPAPHEEAAKRIRDKSPVTRAQFDQLLPELKDSAFLITGVTCFDVLQRVQDMVAQLPEGGKFRALQQQIEDELEPYLGEGEPSRRRAELLLRVHGFRAYSATNYKLMQAHKGAFPYRQYITSGDDRVRSSHAALRFKVFPADSSFWDTHTPPWNWGCRCEAIPLMRDEVDEMRQEDEGLPPESQRVVPDFIVKRAEERGELVVNNGKVINVQTQRERTGNPSAFEWRPGDYGLPMTKIRERYDRDVYNQWRDWAKKTVLPDGKRSIWDAFFVAVSPAKSAGESAPPPPPAKPAAPATTALIPEGGAPVSASLPPGMNSDLTHAATLIDSVHGDGALRMSVITMQDSTNASYHPGTSEVRIGLKSTSQGIDLLHELGHKLDFDAMPGAWNFTTEAGVPTVMTPVLETIRRTKAIQALRDEAARRIPSAKDAEDYVTYSLMESELWARAYAQFIVEESGDPVLVNDLRRRLEGRTNYLRASQWEPEDFAPIRAEIRKLFVSFGWMTAK